jgi:hypothetical protein
MKHKIKNKPENLIIEVSEIKNNKNKVLEGFQKCQEGNCECSSSEYEKVDKIDINTTNDSVIINIKPKKGEKIDLEAVENCVEYIKRKANEDE